MSELRLTFAPDEDGDSYGWLGVNVDADGFTAHASSFIDTRQLSDFLRALGAYPLNSDDGPALVTNIVGDDIQISVVPHNSRGHLRVSVDLSHQGEQLTQTAKISLVYDYSDLEAFRHQLGRVIAGEQIEATLRAHR